jgi:hypothetical protein
MKGETKPRQMEVYEAVLRERLSVAPRPVEPDLDALPLEAIHQA